MSDKSAALARAAKDRKNARAREKREKLRESGEVAPYVSPDAWTPEQNAFLRVNWHTMSVVEIAAHVGRSERGVTNRAARLGLGPKVRVVGGGRNAKHHAMPAAAPRQTAEQFVKARAEVKRKPGPYALGWR